MAYDSKISWTDGTWNPFRGCSRIATGCVRCYAERMAARKLPGLLSPTTGKPFAIMTPSGPRWTGEVEFIESQLDMPLHWKRGRRIFVNSMSDTFHKRVPFTWLNRVFAVMSLSPQHTFIVPTKRIERVREYMTTSGPLPHVRIEMECPTWATLPTGRSFPRYPAAWPLPNVIFLSSVANQADADRDIPILLDTPAAVRGISLEPMIGPVNLDRWISPAKFFYPSYPGQHRTEWTEYVTVRNSALDWVIVGGESGPGARPCNVEWIRDIVRQCREAGVACFVKQMGAVWADSRRRMFGLRKWNRAGADPAEWPAGEWPQEWPEMRRTDGR